MFLWFSFGFRLVSGPVLLAHRNLTVPVLSNKRPSHPNKSIGFGAVNVTTPHQTKYWLATSMSPHLDKFKGFRWAFISVGGASGSGFGPMRARSLVPSLLKAVFMVVLAPPLPPLPRGVHVEGPEGHLTSNIESFWPVPARIRGEVIHVSHWL